MSDPKGPPQGSKRPRQIDEGPSHDEQEEVLKKPKPISVDRIRKMNSRYWLQLNLRAKKWLERTAQHEPSFVLMYLKQTRGRSQIVWEGPQHMKNFTKDNSVLEKFKETALSRSFIPVKTLGRLRTSIKLHSTNPEDYRSDQLYKLISEIVNPGNKRNFFTVENRPPWYPKDVPFRAPNHASKDGQPRLNATQNRKILKAFLRQCPDKYEVMNESGSEESSGNSESDESLSNDSCKSLEDNKAPMSPAEALSFIYNADSWPAFLSNVDSTVKRVDLNCLSDITQVKIGDLQKCFFDERYSLMEQISDPKLKALLSTGNGNCLYNSVSTLLFGDESYSLHLRLASVQHAVQHLAHYLTMLEQELPEVGVATQFLWTVSSSTTVVNKRPCNNPSLVQIHLYTLKTQIKESARVGCDAGFLQILFLAGAVGHPIQQHCSQRGQDLYKLLVPPCSCIETFRSPLNVMWVNFSGNLSTINHLIPLIKEEENKEEEPCAVKFPSLATCSQIEEVCLMWEDCSPSLVSQGKNIEWVSCNRCQSWFHSICVGLAGKLTSQPSFQFSCCAPPKQDDVAFYWPNSRKPEVVMAISDIQSIYPWNGISDAVIDFYVRAISPSSRYATILGPMTYEAIKKHGSREELLQAHKSVNGSKFKFDKPLIVFTCKPRGQWHWIVVAVIPSKQKAYIMDSMTTYLGPDAHRIVADIQFYLKSVDMNAELTLAPVPIKVLKQKTQTDCGINAIHNIELLLNHSPEEIENNTHFTEDFSAMTVRRKILSRTYQETGKFLRQRQSSVHTCKHDLPAGTD